MAGAQDDELASVVAGAGGLGSLPCGMLSPEAAAEQVARFRRRVAAPLHLNFYCHRSPPDSAQAQASWRELLEPYYRELGIADAAPGTATRRPFDESMCELIEQQRPEIVSFHFGLPEKELVQRVLATGATLLATATTVAEARLLEAGGVHAIVAQGAEAGGHRGVFLSPEDDAALGTFALVPQLVDAVRLPVIAAGGIADARGVAAARALGASAVQVGTAYLRCRESTISALHRRALELAGDDATRITNVLTGRPARGIVNRVMRELGTKDLHVPPFPLAAAALAPLRARAEAEGRDDFSPLWAGQNAALARHTSARELTRDLGAAW